MKFDDQKQKPGVEALAGSIRLKARLLSLLLPGLIVKFDKARFLCAMSEFEYQISLGEKNGKTKRAALDIERMFWYTHVSPRRF